MVSLDNGAHVIRTGNAVAEMVGCTRLGLRAFQDVLCALTRDQLQVLAIPVGIQILCVGRRSISPSLRQLPDIFLFRFGCEMYAVDALGGQSKLALAP